MKVLVTTASRTPESADDAPARVEIVTAAQIERRGYRSLLDLLKDRPDFKVDLAGNWDFPAELTVQGMRGAGNVVLLLDGIRVSSPTNEPLPIVANYPIHNARQVEIMYGPASARTRTRSRRRQRHHQRRRESGWTATTSGAFGLFNQTPSYGVSRGERQPDRGRAGLPRQSARSRRCYPADFGGMQVSAAEVSDDLRTMTPNSPVFPTITFRCPAPMAHAESRRFQLPLFENQSHLPDGGRATPEMSPPMRRSTRTVVRRRRDLHEGHRPRHEHIDADGEPA